MSIDLSGLPFNKAVISELEVKLTEYGYKPGTFALEKQTHAEPNIPFSGLNKEYDYTVSISGKQFTIPFSDDVQFAHFLYKLCCEDHDHPTPIADKLDAIFQKIENTLEATAHWLTQDI